MSRECRALRISSIPHCVPRHELVRYLGQLPCVSTGRDFDKFNIESLTLVSDGRTQVATVIFGDEPLCLVACKPGNPVDLKLPINGSTYNTIVDCGFYGMTPLHSSGNDALVEYVNDPVLRCQPFFDNNEASLPLQV